MNYTGTVDFTEQPRRYRWSSTSGWETVRTWSGSKAKLQAFIDTLEAEGGYTGLEILQTAALSTVQATYATEQPEGGTGTPTTVDPISRTWSLNGNELNVSILGHPKALQLYDFNTTWLAKIQCRVAVYKQKIADYYSGKLSTLPRLIPSSDEDPVKYTATDPWGVGLGTIEGSLIDPSSTLLGYAEELCKHLANGVTSYNVSQYSLVKTELVTNASTIRLSHTNVGKMHRYATLLGVEPSLPASLLLNLTGLTSVFWLKKTPTLQQTSQGRFQLTQEYWSFLKYSDFIYDTV